MLDEEQIQPEAEVITDEAKAIAELNTGSLPSQKPEIKEEIPAKEVIKEEIPGGEEKKDDISAKEVENEESPDDIKPEFFEKATGGKIKSKDELEKFFTSHEELTTHAKSLEAEIDNLKKISQANPFEDTEDLYRIGELSKQLKTKDYGMVGMINPESLDKMSPLELIRFRKLLDDPDYKGKEKILDRSLSKEYDLTKPADYEDLEDHERSAIDERIEDNEFKLNKDAKKVRDELNGIWNSVELPKKETPEEAEKAVQEKTDRLVKDWQTPMKELDTTLSKIKVEVPTEKGHFALEIEVPESLAKQKEDVLKAVISQIFNLDLKPDEESIKAVNQMATDAMIAKNFQYFSGEIAKAARKMTDDEWRKIAINPSSVRTADDRPPIGEDLTDEQKEMKDKGLK